MKTVLRATWRFRVNGLAWRQCLSLLLLCGWVAVQAQSTNPSPYCTTAHANMSNNGCVNGWGFYFLQAELNGVTQSLTCNTGTVYRYYNSSNLTKLKKGVTYTLKLQTASTQYATSSAAWIDYGINNSFAESVDFIGSGLGSNAPNLSYTFTVPATATPGVTRLRIRCDYATQISSSMYCNNVTNNYGETIDFNIEIESVNYPDLAVGTQIKPGNVCGITSDSVVTTVYNFGNTNLSNFPAGVQITGTMNGSPVNQTINTTVTATVNSLGQYRLAFPTAINTNATGSLTFKIYTGAATDGDRTNDTISTTMNFFQTPNSPTVSNVDRCGAGTVTLSATPGNVTDVIRWYNAPSGGTLLGTGASITSPFFASSGTVYTDAARTIGTTDFTNSPNIYTYLTGNTSIENGGMMDITPKKTMMINSISVLKVNAGSANWKVYMRTGTYVGNQNNAGAWTLVATANNVTGTSNSFTSINIGNIVLQAGVTYGIYIQCLGSDLWATYYGTQYTGFTASTADLTYVGGTQLYGPFGQNGYWPNYNMNVRFNYTTMCLSNRVPVNVTIKPVPQGTSLLKSTPFNGQFMSGNALDPDITASGDAIAYELQYPNGYNNGQHGTQWTVSSVTVRTPGGTNLPAGNISVTNPSSGGNGKIQITPQASFTDSTLLVTYVISAQGCDTTITRRLFVAPRPVAGFNVNPVCEGDGMKFNNTTVLTSGTISYTWNFGDGGTSTHINPTHTYAGPGTYNVSVTAVSNYGYTHSANQTVTVYENPTAEFSYTNVCQGAVTPFADGSIIPAGTPTFAWDFGDGSAMGTGNNPTHQYANTGVYTVKMRVTANGCSDETTRYVTYAPRAVVDFTPGVVACNNDPVSFTNNTTLSSGTLGYTWAFGEKNATSTQMHTSYDYSGYGNFNITLTATTDMGCVNQKTRSINLTEAPAVSFTNTSLCDVDQVDFTNTSREPTGATTTYEWTFSDGEDFSTKDVSKTFGGVAGYTVTLKAHATNGCMDEVTKTLSIDESPKAEFYANDVCDGNAVQMQNATVGNNGNVTYDWDFGTAGTSNLKDPSVTLPVGTHNITLTVNTPGGCSDMVNKSVTVNAVPQITSTQIESDNKGDGSFRVIANATNGAEYMILWGDGGRDNGTVSGGVIAEVYRYYADGVYDVQIRVENAGCTNNATGKANVFRTALIDAKKGELVVYPNPGTGVFHLDMSGIEAVNVVNVYSSNGQLIQTIPATALSNQTIIDLSLAPAGVYLVSVQTAEGMYNARITLNK